MKPQLVIGLGNPLMGDEGIGRRVAECLATDPRLPVDTDVLCAGTDLLRYAGRMEGRRRILLIDAMLDGGAAGNVMVHDNEFPELEQDRQHAHHLSLPELIGLLQIASPSVRGVRFTVLAVSIESAVLRSEVSAGLKDRIPAIVEHVLDELQR